MRCSRRPRLTLTLMLLAGFIALSALGALGVTRADAASIPYVTFRHHNGYMLPFYDLVVAWSQNHLADKAMYYQYSGEFTGPGGHKYAMYRACCDQGCLDVKHGAATAGAELTTSPCVFSKNSQWWALVNGTLTPRHAADAGLVATFHYPDNPWAWNRLVLHPREGLCGNLEQRFTKILPPDH